jgi:hypothetical protein
MRDYRANSAQSASEEHSRAAKRLTERAARVFGAARRVKPEASAPVRTT